MAYVGISGALMSDVDSNIRKMRDAEVRTIPEVQNHHRFTDKAPDDVTKLFWGEYEHLRAMMPKEWRSVRTDCRLNFEYQLDTGATENANFNVHFDQSDFPPNHNGYYVDAKVPNDFWLVASYAAYRTATDNIRARWEKVNNDVAKFLQNCKSLNEALKLWPDIRFYVPKQYLDRVERKIERAVEGSNALDILKSIDTDGAVAAAVGARLAVAAGERNG